MRLLAVEEVRGGFATWERGRPARTPWRAGRLRSQRARVGKLVATFRASYNLVAPSESIQPASPRPATPGGAFTTRQRWQDVVGPTTLSRPWKRRTDRRGLAAALRPGRGGGARRVLGRGPRPA